MLGRDETKRTVQRGRRRGRILDARRIRGGTGFRVYDIRRGHYHTGHLRISLISIPLTLTTFMSMGVVYSKSRQLMASVPLSEDSLQRPGDLDFPALWGVIWALIRDTLGLEWRYVGDFGEIFVILPLISTG